MKIEVHPYNELWPFLFEQIKQDLTLTLATWHPEIEHFGSTAVPGLSAKPVIDVLVGLEEKSHLDAIIRPMQDKRYIYYANFTEENPERRLFVGLQSSAPSLPTQFDDWDQIPHETINAHRLSHIHVWWRESKEWTRHIAVRDYLIAHPAQRRTYDQIKLKLANEDWQDGMVFNEAKNDFLKELEREALKCYTRG